MNDITMHCAGFDERLSAWLENDLDGATATAMERHAAACDACGELAADLRAIHARAASLPPLTPSRDLWDGIAARIAAPVIPLGVPALTGARRQVGPARRRRAWVRPGLAAAALVVVTAGLTHLLETRDVSRPTSGAAVALHDPRTPALAIHDTVLGATPPSTEAPVASPGGAEPRTPAAATPVQRLASAPTGRVSMPGGEAYRLTGNLAANNMEASYDREITRLRAIVDHNRGQLDTATVHVLERNLQVIDSAIVQCRRALQHDPASPILIESLDNALRSKVELLRTTATMSS
jgi:hypothetical protein